MKLLIVIVIYETKIYDSVAFKSLSENITDNYVNFKIIIYDNSKCKSEEISFRDSLLENYIWDSNNGGVSKAYNYAARYAKANGFDWLLLADQDTIFPRNIIENYIEAINNNQDIKLFLPKVRVAPNGKFMSPVKNYFFITSLSNTAPSKIINPSKYGIINSGMLINVDAFWNVGGYNNKVWLDYSDFQFIERFSNKYHKAFVIDNECIQSFSNDNPDFNQKITRFKLFCSSVKNYQALKPLNKLWIGYSVLKRAISLTVKSRGIEPLYIFLKYYLK